MCFAFLRTARRCTTATTELDRLGYRYDGWRWLPPKRFGATDVALAREAVAAGDELMAILRHVRREAVDALTFTPLPGKLPKERVMDALVAYRDAAGRLLAALDHLAH
jgi:hypothetical protein